MPLSTVCSPNQYLQGTVSVVERVASSKNYALNCVHVTTVTASKRRFCTTKNSRFGCVPTTAKGGDVICVFYGSGVPYILRPIEGGGYMVVGECYINGIMHDETLSDVRF